MLAASSSGWRVDVPAKINLALHVVSRLPGGYHELLTVFQAIDLWDTMTIQPSSQLTLSCRRSELQNDQNLILRAARLLQQECGSRGGLHFDLVKRIPVEGGMGGGSANAAGALIACNQIWDLNLSTDDLMAFGRRLGADVPFFLAGGTALATGRGDQIQPLPPVARQPLLLAIPPFGTPTGPLFDAATKRLTLPNETVNFRAFFDGQDSTFLNLESIEWMHNDLESTAFETRAELARMASRMTALGARRAMLSGSGSTLFALHANVASRDLAKQALCAEFSEWSFLSTSTIQDGVRMTDGRSIEEGI